MKNDLKGMKTDADLQIILKKIRDREQVFL